MAAGLGASVSIMDVDLERLRYLDDVMPQNVNTVYSNPTNIHARVQYADLVVGAVLLEGARAPNLAPRAYLKDMRDGGRSWTSPWIKVVAARPRRPRPTTTRRMSWTVSSTTAWPTCPARSRARPRSRSRTRRCRGSSSSRTWARTRPSRGLRPPHGANAWKGKITHPGVAAAFDMAFETAEALV